MLRNFKNIQGCALAATDGEIGHVREFYFDDEHWKIRYLLVTTGSWLFGREVLIAPHVIGGIDEDEHSLAVHLTMDEVRHAPPIETAKPVSRQYEEVLTRYYGWDPYWSFGGSMGMPIGTPPLGVPVEPVAPITTHLRSSNELHGYKIHAIDEDLGKVEDFIIDDQLWNIRYLAVRPGNWLSSTHVLLSPEWIRRVSYENAEVVVNLPATLIKTAPAYDDSMPVSRAYEEKLHDHYDLQAYWVPKTHFE